MQILRPVFSFLIFEFSQPNLLYPTFVRPHLEFASAAWNNMSAGDAEKLESVQHKATKMVQGLKGYSYYDRLRILVSRTWKPGVKEGILYRFIK